MTKSIRPPDHTDVDKHLQSLYGRTARSVKTPLFTDRERFVRFETDNWVVEIVGDKHEYHGGTILPCLWGHWVRTTRGTALFLDLAPDSIGCRAQAWPKNTESDEDTDALPGIELPEELVHKMRAVALFIVFCATYAFLSWFINI